MYVLVLVTLVYGAPDLDIATRMDTYRTLEACQRDVPWWNAHIADLKKLDDDPNTGVAVCVEQPDG
jgi:hypothetical protein